MLWVTLCIIFATFLFVKILLSLQGIISIRNAVKKLPCPPGAHWLTGHLNQDPFAAGLQWLRDTVTAYPRAYVMWNGPIALPVLVHPDTIKPLLSTSTNTKKSVLYAVLEDWLGEGLVTSYGAIWKRNRRLLTGSFHLDVLKTYMAVYNDCLEVFLGKLDRLATQKKPMRVCHELSLCTFDIVLLAVFSYHSNVQLRDPLRDGDIDFLSSTETATRISQARAVTGNPFLLHPWTFRLFSMHSEWTKAVQYMHCTALGLINTRKDELQKKIECGDPLTKPRDFLDTVLMARDEDGSGLTTNQIKDEVNTFLFGGHDTTASTLTWVLYTLAKHPEHQTKVQEEVDEILNGRDSDTINSKDLGRMDYISIVIKETIRLYTTVILPTRGLTDPLDVDGVILPAGTTVGVNLYQLHHNPTVWGDDHMDFKPSRFLPENFAKMDPFAYLPFSAGPRNCIGQQFAMNEMKVIVARILRRFRLKLVKGEPEPIPNLNLTVKPLNELLLVVEQRKDI